MRFVGFIAIIVILITGLMSRPEAVQNNGFDITHYEGWWSTDGGSCQVSPVALGRFQVLEPAPWESQGPTVFGRGPERIFFAERLCDVGRVTPIHGGFRFNISYPRDTYQRRRRSSSASIEFLSENHVRISRPIGRLSERNRVITRCSV